MGTIGIAPEEALRTSMCRAVAMEGMQGFYGDEFPFLGHSAVGVETLVLADQHQGTFRLTAEGQLGVAHELCLGGALAWRCATRSLGLFVPGGLVEGFVEGCRRALEGRGLGRLGGPTDNLWHDGRRVFGGAATGQGDDQAEDGCDPGSRSDGAKHRKAAGACRGGATATSSITATTPITYLP